MIFSFVSYDAESNEVFYSQEIEDPMIEKEGEIKFRDGLFEKVSSPFIILVGSVEVDRGDDVSPFLENDISDDFRFREATKADILEQRLDELIKNLEAKEEPT